ncbi:AP-1 complex-associated regulatory protein-like isoform X2 [Ruditapes philippinarum]|uniref:AP-1 complex-associated regulatory protein-like isoform X2 n=1 Tax=Ruditapes philippinarum TaxID=129788 RepID=UPI00295BEA35|nr:AP-1 complex-associated regulatory protein-like isoform X2 [Ruditapes philippinarum]
MGNCLRKCFGKFDGRRKLIQTRYSVEKETSIEEEVQNEMSKLVTEREKQLLSTKRYNTLFSEQQLRDAEIDRKLQDDEEELRREEEAYIEAKREAAHIAKLQKQKEEAAKQTNGPKSWKAGEDGEWEVAGGEDDFEMFLESVRERSLKATAHLRKDGDGQSSNSSPTPVTRERSHTDGSNSVELEWDHDEDTGIMPIRKERSNTEEDLMHLAQQETRDSPASPALSMDLEWDTEFTASEDKDTQNLLKAEYQIAQDAR